MPITVAAHVLVRVAGLPWSALAPLCTGRTAAVAERLDALEATLATTWEPLCDRLHALIAGEEDAGRRRTLLQLKRKIFNGKAPREPELQQALGDLAEATLRASVAGWAAALAEVEQLRARGATVLADERDGVRNALRALWQDPALRTGILFAQPQLYRNADRLLTSDTSTAEPDRKLERSLIAYVYRMATKTSPFSAFTAVGVGWLADQATTEPRPDPDGASFVLNARIVQTICAALRADPSLQERLPLHVNPTLRPLGDELRFLDCRALEGGDGAGERLRALGRSPVIDLVLRALGECPGGGSVQEWSAALAPALQLPEERLRSLLRALLQAGAIAAALPYDANDPAALRQLATALCPLDAARADALAALQAPVDALSPRDPATNLSRLAELPGAIGAVGRSLGHPEWSEREQHLVHHAAYVDGPQAVDASVLAALAEPLDQLAGLLPLLNSALPYQALMEEQFVAQHGAGGHVACVLDLFDQLCGGSDDPFADAEARSERGRTARALRHGFLEELSTICRGDGHVRELPAELTRRWIDRARPLVPLGPSSSFALQGQLSTDATTQLVINKIMPGHATLFANHAGSAADSGPVSLATRLRQTLARACGDHEPVELVATLGFDAQIHAPLTERCLPYPGEPIRAARGRAIAWSELGVRHDPRTRRLALVDERRQRPLLPLHLGTLSPLYFPPFYRFLTCFGPGLTPDLPLLELMEQRLSAEQRAQLRHYPRLTLGGLTLLRETWCVPAARLCPVASGDSAFGAFVRLRRWARELGLPRQVFVTPMLTTDIVRRARSGAEFRRLHKPFFVDWDDESSQQLFSRFTRGSDTTVLITELLPVRAAARAVEHVFEVYAT